MRKLLLLLGFLCCINLISCRQITTTEDSLSCGIDDVPVVDYSDYVITSIAIREIDELGRSISVEYYYTDFDEINNYVNSIFTSLATEEVNGGIGPLTGRINNAWITLESTEGSSIILNLYSMNGSSEQIILGVSYEQNTSLCNPEFYYTNIYTNEIIAILDFYNAIY